MIKIECTGWCGRIFMDTNGLPNHVIYKAKTTHLCPLCRDTQSLSVKQLHPIGDHLQNFPIKPPLLLNKIPGKQRLYKKLKSRHHTSQWGALHGTTKDTEIDYGVIEEEIDEDELSIEDQNENDLLSDSDSIPETQLQQPAPVIHVDAQDPIESDDENDDSEDAKTTCSVCDSDTENDIIGRWVSPCCTLCGRPKSNILCRHCSTFVRRNARPLLFFHK